MQNTLTVGVLKLGDADYRALLWNGRVTPEVRFDSPLIFLACSAFPNLFQAAHALKEEVLDWNGRNSWHIRGIHNPESCWPMRSWVGLGGAVEETERVAASSPLLGCCATRLPDGKLVAHLFTSRPRFPLVNGGEKVGFPMCTSGANLFTVAEKLLRTCLEGFAHQKLADIAGVHDVVRGDSVQTVIEAEACWPKEF